MPYSKEQIGALVRPDSVNKSIYTDPELFKLEMQRIYGRIWVYVGHDSQVPNVGDYHATMIGDQDVVMVRAEDGKVHVLYNRCPHKGAMVVPEGHGCTGKFFRCPYHGWTFRLNGHHLAAPMKLGLEGTRFDAASPEFSMRELARVDSYRGFVFASQAADGISLPEFLGGARSSLDNFCDRAPEGEVVASKNVFRVIQRANWKVFYENLNDTMHARVTHESAIQAARDEVKAEGLEQMPLRLHIMENNGQPYEFWEKLKLVAFDHGHSYMEGIFDPGSIKKDPISHAHYQTLIDAYGEKRALEILSENRHNTIIYGSGSPHTVFQQFRIIRPLSVDRTLIEIQVFRLKGAPEEVYRRALMYCNVINSPASAVMPDDLEVYFRCQMGNRTHGGEWVSQHRYAGTDKPIDGGLVAINGTSELPMRNQFNAWKQYMLAAA